MQDAVSVDADLVLEYTTPTIDESEATYHLSTMVEATGQPFSGEEIHEIFEEAKRMNKSFAYVAKQRLQGRAGIQTVVSPAEGIPDIAARTEHKPR
jgi:predicted molibdopterin-dependent oxidoreductase YjgC